ncbi:winged helix-turn-helix transcriptional regulator [Streptomyces sp. NPDC057062]|uniref:winged helix-turn-helix transcriptional regulator n=1 Tax=Streptomyces sp. NPDC057062 TaxID=3346011 RepID=UPI0036430E16
MERTLEFVGDRWAMLIVRNALLGATRFSDFQEKLGIATDLLSGRLAKLIEGGILERRSYREPGSRSRPSYHLTPAGKELLIAFGALQQWGDRNCPPSDGPAAIRRSRSTGRSLVIGYYDDKGEPTDLDDVEVVYKRPLN